MSGPRIALIDYGAGNLASVRKGLAAAGAAVFTPSAPDDLGSSTGIVVPGVGHFGATAALENGWRGAILNACAAGIPLFGICLGLQWLFDGSEEAPAVKGLGAMKGRCQRLPPTLKVPHVGWNSLRISETSALLEGVADGTQVYFTHSFAAPITPDTVAVTTHGAAFAAAVERGRIFGVQFHPEKSGPMGIRIVHNFVRTCSRSA